jgi:hypothetical protein
MVLKCMIVNGLDGGRSSNMDGGRRQCKGKQRSLTCRSDCAGHLVSDQDIVEVLSQVALT